MALRLLCDPSIYSPTHPLTHSLKHPSIYPSIHPSFYHLPIHSPSTYLLNQKSVHTSSHSSTYLSIYHLDISLPSFLLFFYPPPSHIHFSVHPPIPHPIHLSFTHLPIYPSPIHVPPSPLAIFLPSFLPSTPSCPTHPSTHLPVHRLSPQQLVTERLRRRGAGGQPPPCSGLGFLMGQADT